MGKDESIQEQRERDAGIAREALPEIVAQLRGGAEPLQIAQSESARLDADLQKMYKWVAFVAEEFERRRRRSAIRGAVLLWGGFAALAAMVGFMLVGSGLSGALWTLPAAGLVLIAAGLYVALTARTKATVPEELFD